MPTFIEGRPMGNSVENLAQIVKNAWIMITGASTAVITPAAPLPWPDLLRLGISVGGFMVGVWGAYHLRQNFKENKRRNDIYRDDVNVKKAAEARLAKEFELKIKNIK